MNARWVKPGKDKEEDATIRPVNERAGKRRRLGSRTETRVHIRVASRSDAEGLRAMLSRCSPATVFRRFHLPYPEVPGWMSGLMLGVGRGDTEVLVAVAEGEIVGHAMYARSGNSAEMAILLEDEWQSRGVGRRLLTELARSATLRGIETFTAEVLGQNWPMLGLASVFPGTEYETEGGVCHVRMPLPASIASATQTNHRVA